MTNVNDGKTKLKLNAKIGYGFGGFGSLMIWNAFILYGLFFFTDIVGFNPAFASLVLSIGAFWGAFTDPIAGYISDNRDPKKGRRRPLARAFAIPLGIVGFLVFTNTPLEGVIEQIYFILIVLMVYTFQSFVDVPLTSLGAEMTMDYDERSSLSSMRSFFYMISIIIGNSFLAIVTFFGDTFADGSMEKGFSYAGLFCGVLVALSLLVCVKMTKGYELETEIEKTSFSIRENLIEPLKNKPFRYVVGMYAFSMAGLQVAAAAAIFYYIFNMGLTEVEIASLLSVMALIGVVGVAVTNFISVKFSKKIAWVVIMGLWAIGIILFPGIWWRDNDPTLITIAIYAVTVGLGTQLIYQLIWAMIPDCVELDEYKTGKRREGLYFGFANFAQKIAGALIVLVVGAGLTYYKYDPSLVTQTEETLDGIANIMGLWVGILVIISVIIGILNPMTKKRHAAILEALRARKADEEYCEDGFKQLL